MRLPVATISLNRHVRLRTRIATSCSFRHRRPLTLGMMTMIIKISQVQLIIIGVSMNTSRPILDPSISTRARPKANTTAKNNNHLKLCAWPEKLPNTLQRIINLLNFVWVDRLKYLKCEWCEFYSDQVQCPGHLPRTVAQRQLPIKDSCPDDSGETRLASLDDVHCL